ncbi:MAG: hypothetical protein V4565_05135 [Bacteroidota bacterium]
MKLKALLILSIITFSLTARTLRIKIGSSERDANVYSNGQLIGSGTVEILLLPNRSATVEIKKVGYLTETLEMFNDGTHIRPKKEYFFTMRKDDSLDASTATDQANVDIEIKTSKKEDEAWRLISEIITSNFDIIETSDKSTGYMRTAWAVQPFTQNTVRTRIVIKSGGTSPLKYKIKLISESSGKPLTSVKNDELFQQWDRVLRKYEYLISELQSRLK